MLARDSERESCFRMSISHCAREKLVTITGQSGVGKSTLLRAIAGLTSFEGRIEVGGGPVDMRSSRALRTKCILVLQHANLWDHLTSIDNVALVRRILHKETHARARQVALSYLELLEVSGASRQYPVSLSGGEQQRVSLARGFAAETPLLLLDEITSQVDLHRRSIIVQAIKSAVLDGRSVVLVTHDLETAALLQSPTFRLMPHGLEEIQGLHG